MTETIDRKTVPEIEVAVLSEAGKREENQDWMGWSRVSWGECYTLADGMGGYKGGATASRMSIEGIERSLKEQPSDVPFPRALQAAVQKTNREIYTAAQSGDPEVSHMGSTLAVALVSGRQLMVGNIGDSRVYLHRKGKLRQLTTDHTSVQRMVDAGMLTSEQARSHPEAHILNRALGSKETADIEVAPPLMLEDGDGVLLCSDGLSGYAKDDQIAHVLRRQGDVQQIPKQLVKLALECGSDDNITVQYIRYRQPGVRASMFRFDGFPRIVPVALVAILCLGLILAIPSIRTKVKNVWQVDAHSNVPQSPVSAAAAQTSLATRGDNVSSIPSPVAIQPAAPPSAQANKAKKNSPDNKASARTTSNQVGDPLAKVPAAVTSNEPKGPITVVIVESLDTQPNDLSKQIRDVVLADQRHYRLETQPLSPSDNSLMILYPPGLENDAGDLQSQMKKKTGQTWTLQPLGSDTTRYPSAATAHPDKQYLLITIPRQAQ